MADDKLRSDQSEDYKPTPVQESGGRLLPHGEVARTTVTTIPLQYNRRLDRKLVSVGADVRKFAQIAKTNRDVALALNTVLAAVFWVKGEIQSANNYEENPGFEPLDRHIIDEINWDLGHLLHQPWEPTQKSLVQAARECGFAVAEKVWEPHDNRWRLSAIKTKQSWDFNPVVDPFDNLYAIYHYKTGQYFKPGPFIWGVYPHLEYGDWLGESAIEPVYNDLLLIEQLEAAQAANADKSALRIILHNYLEARDETEQKRVNTNLDDAFNGKNLGIIHSPAVTMNDKGEWKPDDLFDMLESRVAPEAMKIISEILTERRKEVKRTMGPPDDLGGTTTPNGSWAKADVVMNVFVMQAQWSQDWLTSIVNRDIIKCWIDLNYPNLQKDFPDFKYPIFTYPEIEEDVSLVRAEYVEKLLQMGVLNMADPADAEWISDYLKTPLK